ncbi:NUDIX hydrolase [Actinomadura sp. 21ATH]|uniref:NUDIX hydrolase n=1 Tax=Actinomadura sp. 21ATH TaxID=1735444 RepID=UPI0035BEF5E4
MADTTQCDGYSVGVVITDDQGRTLIGDRTDDTGAAGPAGHVYDEHSSFRSAARAEVAEEVGLTVTALTEYASGFRANRCCREPGPLGHGHQWLVFRATVTGRLKVDPGSFRNVRWATRAELELLAARTLTYARGEITADDWRDLPGIEPVWVLWLVKAHLIAMSRTDLETIENTL